MNPLNSPVIHITPEAGDTPAAFHVCAGPGVMQGRQRPEFDHLADMRPEYGTVRDLQSALGSFRIFSRGL